MGNLQDLEEGTVLTLDLVVDARPEWRVVEVINTHFSKKGCKLFGCKLRSVVGPECAWQTVAGEVRV